MLRLSAPVLAFWNTLPHTAAVSYLVYTWEAIPTAQMFSHQPFFFYTFLTYRMHGIKSIVFWNQQNHFSICLSLPPIWFLCSFCTETCPNSSVTPRHCQIPCSACVSWLSDPVSTTGKSVNHHIIRMFWKFMNFFLQKRFFLFQLPLLSMWKIQYGRFIPRSTSWQFLNKIKLSNIF